MQLVQYHLDFYYPFFLKKTDPRLKGSKNIGATNIARLSGWKIGLLTLILDISKVFSQYFFFK